MHQGIIFERTISQTTCFSLKIKIFHTWVCYMDNLLTQFLGWGGQDIRSLKVGSQVIGYLCLGQAIIQGLGYMKQLQLKASFFSCGPRGARDKKFSSFLFHVFFSPLFQLVINDQLFRSCFSSFLLESLASSFFWFIHCCMCCRHYSCVLQVVFKHF